MGTNGQLAIIGTNGTLTIGPQNTDWCHFYTDRGKFYMDKPLCVNGDLWSYNGDLYIGRGSNGVKTNRIALYTWGTYVYNHLTMEDVFALVNVQGSEPAAPTTGVKIYLQNVSGVIRLRAKFASTRVKDLALDQ